MKNGHSIRLVFGVLLLATACSVVLSAQANHIKGTVKYPSGRPLNSVWVTISQDNVEKGRSLTGDDGKYYISNLDGGTYEIVVLSGTRQIYKGQVDIPQEGNYDILIQRTR
jgi:hypothetical protein